MRLTVRTALLAALVLAGLVAAGPAQARFVHFTSPSGNIDCLGDTTKPVWVQCYVEVATWPNKRPFPSSCENDWFPTQVQLQNRKVLVGSCRGDVGPSCIPNSGDRCSVLPYGRSTDIGAIRCTSAMTGVTCRYKTAARVGFKVSKQSLIRYAR